MKISENRRSRGEKKALARHDHQSKQNQRFEKKFEALASAIARGDEAAARDDLAKLDVILRQAGKTPADLQARIAELQKKTD